MFVIHYVHLIYIELIFFARKCHLILVERKTNVVKRHIVPKTVIEADHFSFDCFTIYIYIST